MSLTDLINELDFLLLKDARRGFVRYAEDILKEAARAQEECAKRLSPHGSDDSSAAPDPQTDTHPPR